MKKKSKKGKMAKNREAVARAAEKKAAKPSVAIVEPAREPAGGHNGLMSLEQAKEHAEQGQQMATQIVNDYYALALHALAGLEHGAPKTLGLSDTKWLQNTYRGSWQMVRRVADHIKRLKGVPIAELRQIPDCNAHAMRLLPENLRTTKQWLDLAKNETGEAFTEAVYAKRAELGIQDEAMVKTNAMVKINSLPASLAPLFDDCMKHAAREHELDLTKKEGKIDAFQVMVMHYHQTFCVEVPKEAGA